MTHMTTVASRGTPRDRTAEVLRQVSQGTRVTITVNGEPVAEIGPVSASRPHYFAKSDLHRDVTHRQADPGLTGDLEMLAGATTDELEAQ